jgi:prepilin-type N-terminal cleavage/methylation domain-containing protein
MKSQENAEEGYFKDWVVKMTAKDIPVIIGLPLKDHGFTLVELIIVCAVLGVLTTMAVPAFKDMTHKAIIGKAKTEIRVIEKAITAYAIDRNKLPDQLSEIGAEANFLDPWKHPYQYYNIGTGTGSPGPRFTSWKVLEPNLNDDYDLYSMGENGATDPGHAILDPTLAKNDSSDDIVRTDNGGTVELASEY